MKPWFRYFSFFLILGILIAVSIIEDKIVSNSLIKVNDYCFEIENAISEDGKIKNMDMVMLVDNLEYEWKENEDSMCFMVNHKSIQEIGVEISKMKSYLAGDDVKEFKASLELIKFYTHSYLHFMGASWHNVL
ncbi:MAG: DUF4363 family protein [Clostridia bacterium]|nr:DUF4363 family protein [Clostridia bacterium]